MESCYHITVLDINAVANYLIIVDSLCYHVTVLDITIFPFAVVTFRLRPVNMHTSVNGVGCANDPFEDLFAMVNFIFGFKTVEKLCNSNKF